MAPWPLCNLSPAYPSPFGLRILLSGHMVLVLIPPGSQASPCSDLSQMLFSVVRTPFPTGPNLAHFCPSFKSEVKHLFLGEAFSGPPWDTLSWSPLLVLHKCMPMVLKWQPCNYWFNACLPCWTKHCSSYCLARCLGRRRGSQRAFELMSSENQQMKNR